MASRTKHTSTKSRTAKSDAIALLKADHRQVEEWFSQFASSRSSSKKEQLASNISRRLDRAHGH